MRVRAVPFTDEVADFIKKYDQVFVVEMNRNGQMNELLKIEYPEYGTEIQIGRVWRRLARICKMGSGRNPCQIQKRKEAAESKNQSR